jgi:hypothetical protein
MSVSFEPDPVGGKIAFGDLVRLHLWGQERVFFEIS